MTETKSANEDTSTIIAAPAEGAAENVAHAVMLPEGRVQVWRKWLVVLALVFSDAVLASLVWGVAAVLRGVWGSSEILALTVASIPSSVVVWVGINALLGLYPGYGLDAAETLRRQTYSVGATLAITAVFALAFQIGDALSRLLLGLGFLILLLVAPLARYLVKWSMMKFELWGNPVAILGAAEAGAQLVRGLQREWGLGFKPAAFFNFRLAPVGGVLEGVLCRETVADALGVARKHGIDTVIFAMPDVDREYLAECVEATSFHFRRVILVPDLLQVTTSAVVARDLAGIFGVEIKHNLLDPWALRAKRMLDLAVTIVGTLILPLLLVISFLVWVDSRGSVFYAAQRVGRDGKLFSCLKFRTMVPEAETMLHRMLEESPETRGEYLEFHKLRKDPRVTRIGRFLRKTSLDELPQLWNVFRGEMSLVGPRPYLPRESEKVGTAQKDILRVPPGITGLWQVAGRSHTSFSERVQMDAYYVRNWSVWLDLVILARTVKALFFSRTAY